MNIFHLLSSADTPFAGAERPRTTSRVFGSGGLDLLGPFWGLSGVEGGRKVGSSYSSSEDSSSEVKRKGETSSLSDGG